MSDHSIQSEEPEYRTKRDDVKKHFEEMSNNTDWSMPKYPLLVDPMETFAPAIAKMVGGTYDGLKAGVWPKPIKEGGGVSGSYYLCDPSEVCVSVFKPRDEEKKAVNQKEREEDQDRITISSFFGGIPVGGAAAREIAAYYLDHSIGSPRKGLSGGEIMGFGGVPPTLQVKCLDERFKYTQGYEYKFENYKIGSLQMYMENKGSFTKWKNEKAAKRISKRLNLSKKEVLKIFNPEERKLTPEREKLTPEQEEQVWNLIPEVEGQVLALIPVDEVQKMSVVDIRLVNLDRHAGNILVNKIKKTKNENESENPNVNENENENGKIVLIPIDHGYSLPTRFDRVPSLEWHLWPQARDRYTDKVIEYINSQDADKDLAYLKSRGFTFHEKLPRTFRIATKFLQQGVKKRPTPFGMGNLLCKENEDGKTFIMEIIDEAEQTANDLSINPSAQPEIFLGIVYCIMHKRFQSMKLEE
ncbi:Phosphatidylinositol 4-kinase gamma 3 [Euphorbia peplus]|nr:Phosphatidylinositol 4-kinase gamma 3 [Euphorbia peplus]